MQFQIKTDNKRLTVKLWVEVRKPLTLRIKAYDPQNLNSHYFRRKLTFNQSYVREGKAREVTISLPVSPKVLHVIIEDERDKEKRDFKLLKWKLEELPRSGIWASPERHRFMEFAIDFAQKAGHVPVGFYSSSKDEFLIQYLKVIRGSMGEELATPARIHREMPRVQLARDQFLKFSIPVRVAILSHEGCHFFLNTRSEETADHCGIKYYLDYGFPKIEAVYALTKVFRMNGGKVGQVHVDRTERVVRFIDDYQKEKQKKIA